MSQVRFLDQVAVTAFASNAEQLSTPGRMPRVLQSGETFIIQPNQQLVGFELFILPGALLEIKAGEQISTNPLLFTHGLLQIEDIIDNQGTIINNGYLILGTELQ